ncbi:hypothetical protein BaRGS_00008498 [Batillaria attramentaria]|uniref:Uncharacterized protein n=1 Tax=Batillaria attramentaria TaxID=370345 RepID=A0ABD0LLB9_9CAEN
MDRIVEQSAAVFQVRYTGFRDRPPDERQLRFQTECREGHADLSPVFADDSVSNNSMNGTDYPVTAYPATDVNQ